MSLAMMPPRVWRCPSCSTTTTTPTPGGLCRRCARAQRWERACARLAVPPAFEWSTFGAAELLASRIARGRAAVADAFRAVEARTPLVFVGPTGAGKTSLGVAALRARLAIDFDRVGVMRLRFMPAHLLAVARSLHPLGVGEAPAVLDALRADVVLLDDLGAESTRHADVIAEIVHARHDAGHATWTSTGLSPETIGQRYGGGVERRLFERATVIRCGRDGAR